MNTATTIERPIISTEELLNAWKGHRNLTRKVIEVFPEKDLFSFSVGGMRPFVDLCKEMITVSAGGLKQIITGVIEPFEDAMPQIKEKADLLQAWDEATEQISIYFPQISAEKFHEDINLFGEYKFPVIENIQYFIDNEIHHRAQGYVYLRALGIEPPFFWDRY
ncbi:DinB family protein [Niabella ginsengisoli]|uniref:DinB family protein n=1 Tax=Niabella ginsengisoli TaxID=522298 RepID=A0ABS9SHL7_9BACT|nr:DinB family protein [Niabella ginsengisoli]MCH5597830.1 DinB family protein [Niabella ginsengisoli]